MQDINASFCFICLLHLANERGLKIEVGESPGAEDEGQPEEGDNKVGDLWGLKVILFSSFCSGTDCHFFLRSSETQAPFPQRERGGWIPSDQRTWFIYSDASTCFLSFCSFFILSIVLFSPLFSDIYVYVLCCSVSPTSLCKAGASAWILFERSAGEQIPTSCGGGRFDLIRPNLYRSAFRPSFTL